MSSRREVVKKELMIVKTKIMVDELVLNVPSVGRWYSMHYSMTKN